MPDEALNEVVQSSEAERYSPAQFNLFTGAAELIPIEIAEPEEPGLRSGSMRAFRWLKPKTARK